MADSVDVLVAAYNGERYLADQIHSLFRQIDSNLGVIVRDDASTDKTCEVIQQLQGHYPRLVLLKGEKNQGLIENFSHLLQYSDADYILLSDQDDVWLESKVAKSLTKMRELENMHGKEIPLLVHSDLAVVDHQLNPISPSFWRYSHLDPHRGLSLNRLLAQNTTTGCTILMNRKLVNLILPIPSQVVMHDWWIALVAAAFGKIGILNEATILYRQHDKNDTGAKKYGVFSCLQRLLNKTARKKIERNQSLRYKQAEEFLKRYQAALSLDQQHLVRSFLRFEKASIPTRVSLLTQHGFYKQGVWRNLYEICR